MNLKIIAVFFLLKEFDQSGLIGSSIVRGESITRYARALSLPGELRRHCICTQDSGQSEIQLK
jgi:hypothetical protein